MQNPIHPGSARYSFPARCETAWNPACVRQTDPFSVLDASPLSGEPGWSSEGTWRGGRNKKRGVFGNGVTYAARGPVNRGTGALSGFSLREDHRESGPLDPYLIPTKMPSKKKARLGKLRKLTVEKNTRTTAKEHVQRWLNTKTHNCSEYKKILSVQKFCIQCYATHKNGQVHQHHDNPRSTTSSTPEGNKLGSSNSHESTALTDNLS
jgi:hypothetical protein